jgi:DNA-binding NarL/FixJ family response regulator
MDLIAPSRGPASSTVRRQTPFGRGSQATGGFGNGGNRPVNPLSPARTGTPTAAEVDAGAATTGVVVPEERQPAPIRVLIVDDHRVAAEALAWLLNGYPNIAVIGWAETVSEAVSIADDKRADVAIVDFRLSGQRWSEAAAAIRHHRPATSVVIVNAEERDEVLIDAVEAGVAGYLVKSASGAEVVAALRRVMTGEALIPARKLAEVLAGQRQVAKRREEQAYLLGSLTQREREILALMARGLDNRTMARDLGIGYSTVRSHVRGVLEKFGVHSKLEAVARAMELDLLRTEVTGERR